MKQVRWTLVVVVALILTGTLGYMLIEGWSFFDSLYIGLWRGF